MWLRRFWRFDRSLIDFDWFESVLGLEGLLAKPCWWYLFEKTGVWLKFLCNLIWDHRYFLMFLCGLLIFSFCLHVFSQYISNAYWPWFVFCCDEDSFHVLLRGYFVEFRHFLLFLIFTLWLLQVRLIVIRVLRVIFFDINLWLTCFVLFVILFIIFRVVLRKFWEFGDIFVVWCFLCYQ